MEIEISSLADTDDKKGVGEAGCDHGLLCVTPALRGLLLRRPELEMDRTYTLTKQILDLGGSR